MMTWLGWLGVAGAGIAAFVFALMFIAYKKRKDQEWAKNIPGPPEGNLLFGNLSSIVPLSAGPEFLLEFIRGRGPIIRIDTGLWVPGPIIMVLDYNAARIALRSEWKGPFYEIFKIDRENNIFIGEGEFWRTHRRIANPAFSYTSVRSLHPIILDEVNNLFEAMEKEDGKYFDLDLVFGKFTLDVIGRTLFGESFGALQDEEAPVLRAIRENVTETKLRGVSPMRKYFHIPARRRYLKNHYFVYGIGRKAIAKRRQQKNWEQINDLLTMLMSSTDEETGVRMSDDQIAWELAVFIAAGHDTTSHSLAFTVQHLMENPEAMKKVRDEIDQVMGDRKLPTPEDLKQMKYVSSATKESMRLSPVAPLGSIRAMTEDVELCGHMIKKGTSVWIPFYPLFRDASLWPEPEKFDIERFLNEEHQKKFFPFSAGPRNCIGQTLAKFEMHLALTSVLRNYDFELKPGAKVEAVQEVTLKPRGLFVRAIPRSKD